MARTRTVHRCTSCGAAAPKWAGRCDGCGEWNTLVEELDVRDTPTIVAGRNSIALPIADVVDESSLLRSTGLVEVDRVLGGGLVPGSVTLVGGEPGIGKSTLMLQLAGSVAAGGQKALYVSGEESASQVRGRADRLGALHDGLGALHDDLWLVGETVLPHVLGHLDEVKAEVVVIDSVQTLVNPEMASAPGSVAQVRECAHELVQEAKRAASHSCWWAMSRRREPWPVHGFSSMWSTPCSSSMVTASTGCACCGPRNTASAPPPRSGFSRWTRWVSPLSTTRPGSSSPIA